jgi:hypothetical protein
LLIDPEIEIVINLTVPLAHGPVSRQNHRGRQARLFGEAWPRASARARR